MSKEITIPTEMVKEIFQDMTPEERLAKLRESADQVVNHHYNRPYTEDQISEIRTKISDLCVKISDYERELAAIKAEYKSKMQPLENDLEQAVSDLRMGGEYVTEECFVYLNFNIGKAGLYTKEGVLLNEMDITPEMSQSTIFQALREDPDDQAQAEDDKPLLPAPETSEE